MRASSHIDSATMDDGYHAQPKRYSCKRSPADLLLGIQPLTASGTFSQDELISSVRLVPFSCPMKSTLPSFAEYCQHLSDQMGAILLSRLMPGTKIGAIAASLVEGMELHPSPIQRFFCNLD